MLVCNSARYKGGRGQDLGKGMEFIEKGVEGGECVVAIRTGPQGITLTVSIIHALSPGLGDGSALFRTAQF